MTVRFLYADAPEWALFLFIRMRQQECGLVYYGND